jgi:hypothetical protein
MRIVLWILGGMCCATGVLSLFFSFGPEYTKGNCPSPSCAGISTALDKAGWDALADLGLKDPATFGLPILFFGIFCLAVNNATAWKQTGGY